MPLYLHVHGCKCVISVGISANTVYWHWKVSASVHLMIWGHLHYVDNIYGDIIGKCAISENTYTAYGSVSVLVIDIKV